MYANTKTLVKLIENEKDQNAMSSSLNVIRCGLYSSEIEVVTACSKVLSRIGQEVNLVRGELAGLAWDWFVDKSRNSFQDVEVLDLHNEMDTSPFKIDN